MLEIYSILSQMHILFHFFSTSLTQADLLPRVGREQEHHEGHGGEEHTGDEEVESVEQGPPS